MSLQQALQSWGLKTPTKEKAAVGSTIPHIQTEEVAESVPLGGEPGRRRLRHLSQLALRGLDVGDGAFRLQIATAAKPPEILDVSDAFRTRNPTWALVCGLRHGRQLQEFQLRVVSASPERGEVLWSEVVRLQELEPLGEELGSLQGVSRRPLLQLGDLWYQARPASETWSTTPGALSVPPRRAHAAIKRLSVSQLCTAGETICGLLRQAGQLEDQSLQAQKSMEGLLKQRQELGLRRSRRAACQQEVEELKAKLQRCRLRVATLREQCGGSSPSGVRRRPVGRREWLEGAMKELHEAEALRRSVGQEVEKGQNLPTLWLQLRCRQIRMLHELREVYPLEKRENYWTIRGRMVVSMESLARQDLREEEEFSTALGYLTHLLQALCNVLQVPLKVLIQRPGCSRSALLDPHESPEAGSPSGAAAQTREQAAASLSARELPLHYGRGLDRQRFERALRSLRDGLHQFLYSRGYLDHRWAAQGRNLLELLELILRSEMYGPGPLP